MSVELSVLVVHYYTEELLRPLFDSMHDFLSNYCSEVLIWDNGSQSNSPINWAIPCPLSWFPSSVNVGFAKGHNALAERAHGQRLLIINPDTEFAPDGLERLWKAAIENPQAGAVAPRILSPDGRLQASIFSPYTFDFDLRKSFWLEKTGLFSGKQAELEKKLNEAKGTFPIGWASGACLLVSREAWEKVGGFDSNFFFGGEDADFCQRMWEAGYEVLCEPRAGVIHQAGQSLEREPKRKVLFYYQKRLYYAHKHFSRLQYGILWMVSTGELTVKWGIGLFTSLFSCRWREKRKGFAEALQLTFSGRWRNIESLTQKNGAEVRKPAEAVV